MNFGLLMPFRNPPQWHRPFPQFYAEQLSQVRLAEALGYDTIWLTEHHFCEDGYSPSLLPIASAIATVTSRIRIGTNILLLPLHNAVRVAEDAATIDIISNGRFDLGVGRGFVLSEYEGYGISRKERTSRLEEGLEVIRGLWTAESFSFEGRHYHLNNARLAPMSVQRPHPPIWIGSHGSKTLDMAAKTGYHFLGTGDPAVQNVYDAALHRHGRSAESYNACHGCWVHVADTYEKAWDNAQDHMHYMLMGYAKWHAEAGDLTEDQQPPKMPTAADLRNVKDSTFGTFLIGTPQQVTELIKEMRERVRTTHLAMCMHLPGLEPAKSRRSLELFAHEVMPAFR